MADKWIFWVIAVLRGDSWPLNKSTNRSRYLNMTDARAEVFGRFCTETLT